MTIYSLRKKNDFENLRAAINSYEPASFVAKGNVEKKDFIEKININKALEGADFDIIKENGFVFKHKGGILYLPLNDYKKGFTIDYRYIKKKDSIALRVKPYDLLPNDPRMPKVDFSVFTNVIDGVFVELSFHGKVKLEKDWEYEDKLKEYWKVAKKI